MPKDTRDELREEWLLLQKQYEDFDQRALTLKSYATPLLGVGFVAGVEKASSGIIVATIAVAACFWALETIWKTFQYCFTDRMKALEGYFREPDRNPDFKPYQIFTSWGEQFTRDRCRLDLWVKRSVQPFVLLPYVPMIIAGLCLLFL